MMFLSFQRYGSDTSMEEKVTNELSYLSRHCGFMFKSKISKDSMLASRIEAKVKN